MVSIRFSVLSGYVQHANQGAIHALFYFNSAFIFECFEERKDSVPAPIPTFGKVTNLSQKGNANTPVKVQVNLCFLSVDEVKKRLVTGRFVRQRLTQKVDKFVAHRQIKAI